MPEKLISHKALLHVLPPEVEARLRERGVRKTVPDGTRILEPDSEIDGLYGIVSGQVTTLGTGPEGRPFALTVLGPGEWFGEISLFDGLPRIHTNVARGEVELWFVPKREFHDLVRREPGLHAAFVELLCRRLRMTFAFIEDMAFRDLPERLAKRLLELAADHGEPVQGGTRIALRLPQEELGTMLAASRERVGRHLKSWEREGWLRLEYGRVVVCDEAALRALFTSE